MLRVEGFIPGDSNKFHDYCVKFFGDPLAPNPTASVEAAGTGGSTPADGPADSLLVKNHGTLEQNDSGRSVTPGPAQDARRDRDSNSRNNDVEELLRRNLLLASEPRAPEGQGQRSSGAPPPPQRQR